jgi:hypothetical protein
MGRLMVISGLLLAVVGVGIWLAERGGLPVGRLPGDIVYRGKNTVVVFPLATCILISIVLTVISWIFNRR